MNVHDTRPVIVDGIALRAALVLAVYGQAMFFLAAIGQLRPVPIIAVTLVAITFMWRGRPRRRTSETPPGAAALHALHLLVFVPLVVLALYPPIAFDETLYHLPFVRAFARDGALRFLPDLRF